jgi:hypothetical protein
MNTLQREFDPTCVFCERDNCVTSDGAGNNCVEKCCGSEASSTCDSTRSWWIWGFGEVERGAVEMSVVVGRGAASPGDRYPFLCDVVVVWSSGVEKSTKMEWMYRSLKLRQSRRFEKLGPSHTVTRATMQDLTFLTVSRRISFLQVSVVTTHITFIVCVIHRPASVEVFFVPLFLPLPTSGSVTTFIVKGQCKAIPVQGWTGP